MHQVTEYLKRVTDRTETTDRMIDWAILYVNDLEYAPRLASALKRGSSFAGGSLRRSRNCSPLAISQEPSPHQPFLFSDRTLGPGSYPRESCKGG
jgi:hypothetical protein